MPSNVKVSVHDFKKLQPLFIDTRRRYIKSQSSRAKTADKKNKTDKFMMDWMEKTSTEVRCVPINSKDEKLLSQYIRKKLVTSEYTDSCVRFCVKLINMMPKYSQDTVAEDKEIIF